MKKAAQQAVLCLACFLCKAGTCHKPEHERALHGSVLFSEPVSMGHAVKRRRRRLYAI